MSKQAVIVINEENVRGIVASSSAMSKEMLDDLIDLVTFSDTKTVASINRGFKNAKKFTDGRALRKKLGA